MKEYFHCAHDPNLRIGGEFNLFPNVAYQPRQHEHYTIPEAYQKYDQLFPNGISNHGRNHLYFNPTVVEGVNYYAEKNLTEHLFETIRMRDYPDRPSRFKSYFGCLTLEDARKIRDNGSFTTPRTIYRVSCENAFETDMSWIALGESIPGTFLLADKYWTQQVSNEPLMEALIKSPMKILEKIE